MAMGKAKRPYRSSMCGREKEVRDLGRQLRKVRKRKIRGPNDRN